MKNTIDLRTTAGKRLQQICQVLIEGGTTHNGWTLDYTYQTNNDLFEEDGLHNVSVGEMVLCINIIRTTFGLQQLHYQMTNKMWEWDYTYPTL